MSVGVNDNIIEKFLPNFLFIEIGSEVQSVEGRLGGKETIMRCDICGWDGDV